ncbi:MAG TPA: hypothetical protein VHW65_04025 [Gemmatimonadales bacterium]|jgi:hypothetical protein|nr:hypothetical protein [Gemmatimonadales bacterium]
MVLEPEPPSGKSRMVAFGVSLLCHAALVALLILAVRHVATRAPRPLAAIDTSTTGPAGSLVVPRVACHVLHSLSEKSLLERIGRTRVELIRQMPGLDTSHVQFVGLDSLCIRAWRAVNQFDGRSDVGAPPWDADVVRIGGLYVVDRSGASGAGTGGSLLLDSTLSRVLRRLP